MDYVSLDPSFTGTGVAVYHNGVIRTRKFSVKMEGKRFVDVARATYQQTDQVIQFIRSVVDPNDSFTLISENPPPLGQFASGLYALDTFLLHEVHREYCGGVFVLNPNYLQHIHGKRKYSKSESVTLAQEFVKAFNLTLKPDGRFSADEAEAVIFLLRLLTRCKVVSGIVKQFQDEKEVRLF